jgi:hypothetical protein
MASAEVACCGGSVSARASREARRTVSIQRFEAILNR